VTVEMIDYGYNISGPLTAGGTLKVSNTGKEFHMMGVGKFKPGKTLTDLVTVLREAGEQGGPTTTTGAGSTTTTGGRGATTTSSSSTSTSTTAAGGQGGGEGQREDPTAEIIDELGLPGNFMGPGESAEITVPNLGTGTYAFVCFIPTEGEGTPHFAKGMVNQLEVVGGTAPPPPTPDATYRVAPGRAIEGPATLTPGRHTLKFEAAAGSEQLEPGIARLNPGTSAAQLDRALEALFEGQEPPARGAAGRVPGQIVFGGFDLQTVSNFTLTVDLRPSDYVIVAEDTDAENPPSPPRELLNLKVA
jgi:hypothetical protein